MKIKIGSRLIGDGEPCFIIAEAGVNHNGDVGLAMKLIDVARDAGADAVKFQTFKAEKLVIKSAEKAAYQKKTTEKEESQYDMLMALELSEKAHYDLKKYTDSRGILFLSTPFDIDSVDLLVKVGVPAIKVSSGDITNQPMLSHIAAKKLPVILSTGMSVLNEVEEAIKVIIEGGNRRIVLLHCVSCYPARTQDMNIRSMETLKNAFHLPVGLSDHTTGITVPIAAVALGACVVEKHFTLDKHLPGPDHKASLTPRELKQMVKAIRDVEKALGDGIKKSVGEEEENKRVARRSLVARSDIPRGARISEKMLDVRRPGTGIESKRMNKVVGRVAKEGIKKGTLITWDKIL